MNEKHCANCKHSGAILDSILLCMARAMAHPVAYMRHADSPCGEDAAMFEEREK